MSNNGLIVLTGDQITKARLIVLKHALQLEIMGMNRSRHPSAYVIVKRETGFKGTRQSVLDQLVKKIQVGTG